MKKNILLSLLAGSFAFSCTHAPSTFSRQHMQSSPQEESKEAPEQQKKISVQRPLVGNKQLLGGRKPIDYLAPSLGIVKVVAAFEGGFQSALYCCTSDVLTIAYGHAIKWEDLFDKGLLIKQGVKINSLFKPSKQGVLSTLQKRYKDAGPGAVIKCSKAEFAGAAQEKALSKAAGEKIFQADLHSHVQATHNTIKAPLHQWEYDTVASLAYNRGATNLRKSVFMERLNWNALKMDEQFYLAATAAILLSPAEEEAVRAHRPIHPEQSKWPIGVRKRRITEASIFVNQLLQPHKSSPSEQLAIPAYAKIYWWEGDAVTKNFVVENQKRISSNKRSLLNDISATFKLYQQ